MVPSVYFSFCLLVSSVSNFCPATRGAVVFHFFFLFFRLTCSVVLWGGRNTANKYHWHVWGVLTVIQPHWVCPRSWCVCFPSLCCSDSRLLCRELYDAGSGLLPRSKPLSFRFSGTPQRCRLGWACVLCLSQAQAAQARIRPSRRLQLTPSPFQPFGFRGVQ